MSQLIQGVSPIVLGVIRVLISFFALAAMHYLAREISATYYKLQVLAGIVMFLAVGIGAAYLLFDMPYVFPFLGGLIEPMLALIVGYVVIWAMFSDTITVRYITFGFALIAILLLIFHIFIRLIFVM